MRDAVRDEVVDVARPARVARRRFETRERPFGLFRRRSRWFARPSGGPYGQAVPSAAPAHVGGARADHGHHLACAVTNHTRSGRPRKFRHDVQEDACFTPRIKKPHLEGATQFGGRASSCRRAWACRRWTSGTARPSARPRPARRRVGSTERTSVFHRAVDGVAADAAAATRTRRERDRFRSFLWRRPAGIVASKVVATPTMPREGRSPFSIISAASACWDRRLEVRKLRSAGLP